MTPADADAPTRTTPDAAPPSTAFGKGFVLDTWYFAALARDVAVASLKRYELLGEPVELAERVGAHQQLSHGRTLLPDPVE